MRGKNRTPRSVESFGIRYWLAYRTIQFFLSSNALCNFRFEISNLKYEILFGGHKAVVRPVPIPNTAVKHSLADGSSLIDSARVGCRQFFVKRPSQ